MARRRPRAQSQAAASSSAGPRTRAWSRQRSSRQRRRNKTTNPPTARRRKRKSLRLILLCARRSTRFSPSRRRSLRLSRQRKRRSARSSRRPAGLSQPGRPRHDTNVQRLNQPQLRSRQARRQNRAMRRKNPRSRRRSGVPERGQHQTQLPRGSPTGCRPLDSRPGGVCLDLVNRERRRLDRIHLGRHRLAARRSVHRPQPRSRRGLNDAHQQQRYNAKRQRRRGGGAADFQPSLLYSLSNCDSKFSAACVLAAAA